MVSYDQTSVQLATVSVLPRQQTMTSDSSIKEVSSDLFILFFLVCFFAAAAAVVLLVVFIIKEY